MFICCVFITQYIPRSSVKKKEEFGWFWQVIMLLCLFSFLSIPPEQMIDDNYLLQRILPPPSSSFSMYCHFHKALTVKNCLVKRSLIWVFFGLGFFFKWSLFNTLLELWLSEVGTVFLIKKQQASRKTKNDGICFQGSTNFCMNRTYHIDTSTVV